LSSSGIDCSFPRRADHGLKQLHLALLLFLLDGFKQISQTFTVFFLVGDKVFTSFTDSNKLGQ